MNDAHLRVLPERVNDDPKLVHRGRYVTLTL